MEVELTREGGVNLAGGGLAVKILKWFLSSSLRGVGSVEIKASFPVF